MAPSPRLHLRGRARGHTSTRQCASWVNRRRDGDTFPSCCNRERPAPAAVPTLPHRGGKAAGGGVKAPRARPAWRCLPERYHCYHHGCQQEAGRGRAEPTWSNKGEGSQWPRCAELQPQPPRGCCQFGGWAGRLGGQSWVSPALWSPPLSWAGPPGKRTTQGSAPAHGGPEAALLPLCQVWAEQAPGHPPPASSPLPGQTRTSVSPSQFTDERLRPGETGPSWVPVPAVISPTLPTCSPTTPQDCALGWAGSGPRGRRERRTTRRPEQLSPGGAQMRGWSQDPRKDSGGPKMRGGGCRGRGGPDPGCQALGGPWAPDYLLKDHMK